MTWKTLAKYTILTFPVGVVFHDCVGTVVHVDGVSMQPTLNPNYESDWLWLNCWAARSYNFKRGDVVVFRSPKNRDEFHIKRIIGLHGDLIRTRKYKKDFVTVPEGHCWVEGDNSHSTLDSNTYGPISLGLIKAKASSVIWPPDRWHKIDSVVPESRLPLSERIRSDFDDDEYVDD